MTTPGERDPHVVTSAYQSRTDELDARKKRYVYAMSARVVLFGVAVGFFRNHFVILVPAMVFAMLAPYVAVVFANGGRKKPAEMRTAYVPEVVPVPAITAGRTIDHD